MVNRKLSKSIIALIICLLVQVSVSSAQSVYKIFVATNGTADAPGTQTEPVNTIAKAFEMAARISATDVKQIVIILRGGTYYVTQSLEIIQGKSWNSSIPLSIEGYRKEVVILHGGKTVGSDMIKPVSDKSYLSRFQPEVRSRIREINLKEVGVDPGKLHPVGFGRPFGPTWMEMFVNGNPGQIARWPNVGGVPIDSVVDKGSTDADKPVTVAKPANVKKAVVAIKPVDVNKESVDDTRKDVSVKEVIKRGGTFFYDNPRPSKWKEPQRAWLSGFFMWGYADDAVLIDKIDTLRRIIKTAMPTRYGFGTGRQFRAYYAYNIPEEIDLPGEYYVDTEKEILYFLPPDVLKSVELSVLESPIIQAEGINHLQIKNIQFTCSRGMGIYTEKTTGMRIDGCQFTNLGMMAIYVGKAMPEADIVKAGNAHARVSGDMLGYMYEHTTFDTQAGTDNGILNCVVYQTGAGGIYLNGGDRLTLKPGHSFIKNCLVHDFNRIGKTFMPGILIAGVGNSISNCELYNSPSVAILVHGNNHLIEYNNIHNTTLEVDDMGAIYYGRDPSERGIIVRYNYFHDIGGLNKTMAVYHDDGACGMLVTGNVFYRAGTVAGFIGGGQDNTYINNVFLNTRYAIHIDKRLTGWAKGVVQNNGLYQKRLEAVNYSQPPYSTAYPTLKDYFNQGPATPQRNQFINNVMVNIERPIEGDTTLIYFDKRNFETIGDPGFKDYAGRNFKIKRGSVIYRNLPEFVAPPLDKMGYHKID